MNKRVLFGQIFLVAGMFFPVIRGNLQQKKDAPLILVRLSSIKTLFDYTALK